MDDSTPSSTMAPEVGSTLAVPATPATAGNDWHSQFITRVSSLPIVSSAIESATVAYEGSKQRYQVLDTFEASLKTRVLPQLKPLSTVLQTYGPRLSHIDSLACSGLDALETRLPIIREPTDRVFETGRRVIDERIIAPVQQARTTVVSQVSHVVERGVQGNVNGILQSALVLSEQAVDRLLPEDTPAADATEGSAAATIDFTPAPANSYERVQHLTSTVRQRLAKRTADGLRKLPLPEPQRTALATTTHEVLEHTAARLHRQVLWLRDSILRLQASVVSTEHQMAANVTESTSRAAVTLRRYANSLLGTVNTAVTSFTAYLPANIQTETEALRRRLTEELQHLQAVPSHLTHGWFDRALKTANAALQYVAAVRNQLLSTIAAHVPKPVATLLQPAAAAPKPADAVAEAAPADTKLAVNGDAAVNGNGHLNGNGHAPEPQLEEIKGNGHEHTNGNGHDAVVEPAADSEARDEPDVSFDVQDE